MHRLKTILYELRITNRPHKTTRNLKTPKHQTQPHLQSQKVVQQWHPRHLDTFLRRVRLEMLNTDQYKQNKYDNLTRKKRFTLRDLINNPHIVINKADKGSTIVVEDRDEYISNAMLHLNDPSVYKSIPTQRYFLHTKRSNQDKFKALRSNGFLRQTWFEFCKPPKQTHTSRLNFFDSQEPHGNKTNCIKL